MTASPDGSDDCVYLMALMTQVVALMLRSSARAGQPEVAVEAEMDYPRILNKALPAEIRVLGWSPVPDDFNARWVVGHRGSLLCDETCFSM